MLLLSAQADATEPGDRTVLDGVYSQAQTARGKIAYNRSCRECHLSDLQGGALEPPLVDVLFMDAWREDYLASLFDFISTRMPKGRDAKPGSLKESEYVDIIAYILFNNDFPVGSQELTRTDLNTVALVGLNGPEPLPPNAMVRSVGCFNKNADGYSLGSAVAPSRVRTGDETDAAEVEKSTATALGTHQFRLNNLDVLLKDDELQKLLNYKVQAKGVLNGVDDTARIFVLSLVSTGMSC